MIFIIFACHANIIYAFESTSQRCGKCIGVIMSVLFAITILFVVFYWEKNENQIEKVPAQIIFLFFGRYDTKRVVFVTDYFGQFAMPIVKDTIKPYIERNDWHANCWSAWSKIEAYLFNLVDCLIKTKEHFSPAPTLYWAERAKKLISRQTKLFPSAFNRFVSYAMKSKWSKW